MSDLNNKISLVLEFLLKNEQSLSVARNLIAQLVAETGKLGAVSSTAADQTNAATKRISDAFERIAEAQKLVSDENNVDDQAAALALLGEEYENLRKVIEGSLEDINKSREDFIDQGDDLVNQVEEQNEAIVESEKTAAQEVQEFLENSLKQRKKTQDQLEALLAKRRSLSSGDKDKDSQSEELRLLDEQIKRTRNSLEGFNEASDKSSKSFLSLGGVIGGLSETLGSVGEQLGPVGAGLGEVGAGLEEVASAEGPVAAVTAGIVALGAAGVITLKEIFNLTLGVKDFVKQGEELERFSGIGKQISAGLQLAASGINATVGDLKDGLAQFQQLQEEAFQGSEDAAETLESIGATDFSNLETALDQIALRLRSTGDLANGVAVEFSKAFGEEGSRQFSEILLKLSEAKERAEEFGLVISEKVVEKVNKLIKLSADLEAQLQGASTIVGTRFLDAFTELGQVVSGVFDKLRNDSAFATQLENIATLIEKIITGPLPAVVNLVATITKETTQLAGAFSALTEVIVFGSTAYEQAVAKIPKAIDVAIAKTKELEVDVISSTDAFKRLEAQLKKFEELRKADQEGRSAVIKQQIALIDELERAGKKSAVDASKEKNEILARDSQIRRNNIESDIAFERDQLKQALESQKEKIAKSGEQEKIILTEREKLQQQYDAKVRDLDKKRAEFLRDLNNQFSRLTQQQQDENIKRSNAFFQNELKNNKGILASKESLAKADERLGEITANRQIALNEITKAQTDFGKKENELRAKREQAEAEANELRIQAEKDTLAAIQSDKEKAVTKANNTESQAIAEQKALLQTKARTAEEVETQITKINIVAQQDRLNAAIAALNSFKEKKIQDKEQQKALEKEIADESIKLDDLKTKQKIDNIDRTIQATKNEVATIDTLRAASFERRKVEISLLKDASLQRIQQGRLEIDLLDDTIRKAQERLTLESLELEKLKAIGASTSEIALQEAKVTAGILASSSARDQAIQKTKELKQAQIEAFNEAAKAALAADNAVAGLADRATSAVAALKGGLTVLGESIDLNSLGLEQLDQRFEELTKHAEFIRNVAAIPDKDVFLREIEETLAAINERKVNLTQRAALEAATKEQEIQLQKARETNAKLLEEAAKREQEILELKKERREDERELDKDRASEAESFNNKLKQLGEDLALDLKEIAERKAAEEKEIADRVLEEEEERQRKLKEIKEKATSAAGTEANDIARKGLLEQLDLQRQINAEKDPKKKAELEAKLAKSNEDVSRAKRKQQEIEKLATENLTEEEFQLRKKAIEDRFDLEEEAANQRLELLKEENEEVRKQALEALNKLIAEEQARKQKALEQELKDLKDAQARKAKQEEEERQRRLAGYDQQAKDRQSAFDKAKADEEKDHKDRVAALDARQKEIRDKYKETYDDINKRAIDSASQIGVTGQAIADAFALGNKELEKYIANLEKAGQAQGAITPGSSPTGGSSSPSSPSSSPSSSPFGGGSSSGNGAFNITTTNASTGASTSQSNTTPSPSTPPASNTSPSAQSSANQNRQSGGGVKNQPSQQPSPSVSVPGDIKDSATYTKVVFDIYDKFDKIVGDQNPFKLVGEKASKVTELLNKLSSANFTYTKGAGLTAEETKAIAPSMPYLLNSKNTKENRKIFTDQVSKTVQFVEQNRKVTSGADKGAGVGSDIGTKSGGITTPDIGSPGGTKGDVASAGNQSGSQTPPPPSRGQDLSDKDKNIFLNREREASVGTDESAEFAKTFGNRPVGTPSPTTPSQQPQTINSTANIDKAVYIDKVVMEASADSIEKVLIELVRSGRLRKEYAEQVNAQNSKDNFARNPGNRIVT